MIVDALATDLTPGKAAGVNAPTSQDPRRGLKECISRPLRLEFPPINIVNRLYVRMGGDRDMHGCL